jgi:uncharacterized protein YjbJ (UPF0337 family)
LAALRDAPGASVIGTQGETLMNWDQIKGKWNEVKGSARKEWGKLTDDDLEQAAGHRDELAGKVQQRYGMAREEAERQVDAWLAKL